MSGHSKWSTIKRAKGATDAKRGVLFGKLAKQINIAVRVGGGSSDPNFNATLRAAIDKAKAASMPNDNIDRAIKKGLGEGGELVEEITYEGYGPGGVALLIETATDNKNRTVSNIKHYLTKHGGSLGAAGSVLWQFENKGQILIERMPEKNIGDLQLTAIDAGAEDVVESDEGLIITTSPEQLAGVENELKKAGAVIASVETIKQSTQPVVIDIKMQHKIDGLLEVLENDEDIIATHTNINEA